MILILRNYAIILAFSLLACGCSTTVEPIGSPAHSSDEAEPRLDETEVIRIAKTKAIDEGIDLRRYERPEAHFEFTRKDNSWFVSFMGRESMRGNHITVTVDDGTGEARLSRGR